MRAAKMFVTGSLAIAGVVLLACGGSSHDAAGTTTDAGNNAPLADGASSEDGGGSEDAADANLNLFTATPPDAALNDSGASVGTCLACAQTTCEKQVAACNDDAQCDSTFSCVFGCIGEVGGTLAGCYVECGGSLTGGGVDPVETALGECALKSCATECATCSLSAKLCPADAGQKTPPQDSGGVDGASDDGSSDAASDDGGG